MATQNSAAVQIGSTSNQQLDQDKISELADMFRLMGDPTRLRIILACLHAPANVGDIAAEVGVSSSLVSHHLRLLRAARVLRADRQGRQVFYAARDQHIQCVVEDMIAHVGEHPEHGEDQS